MELVLIEDSKVVYLTQLYRPVGQLYMPDAIAAMADRYRFSVVPKTIDANNDNTQSFSHGQFGNVAIESCKLYPDGIVVTSRSNTSIVEEFIRDIITWSASELGFVELNLNENIFLYESYITVRADFDLIGTIKPLAKIAALLDKNLKRYSYNSDSKALSISIDSDPSEIPFKKPIKFSLERKAGSPFQRNLFFSACPMRTDDHFSFLIALQDLLGPRAQFDERFRLK